MKPAYSRSSPVRPKLPAVTTPKRCTAPTAASASTGVRAAPSPSARTPRPQQSRRSCTSTGQTGACPPPSRPSARGDRTASPPFISFQIHPPDLQDAATHSACLAWLSRPTACMHAGVQDSLLSTPLRPPPFHSAPKAQRHPRRPPPPASEALCHCTSRGGRLGLAVLPAASRSCRHGPCRPRCATTPPPPRAQDSTQHPHGAGTEPHRRGKHCCVLHPRTRCSCCDCAGLVHGVRSVAAKALRRHSLTCGGAGVPCSWCVQCMRWFCHGRVEGRRACGCCHTAARLACERLHTPSCGGAAPWRSQRNPFREAIRCRSQCVTCS